MRIYFINYDFEVDRKRGMATEYVSSKKIKYASDILSIEEYIKSKYGYEKIFIKLIYPLKGMNRKKS